MFFIVRESFVSIFTKKYWYLSPLEIFENENFDVRAPARATRTRTEILDFFGFSTLHPTEHAKQKHKQK